MSRHILTMALSLVAALLSGPIAQTPTVQRKAIDYETLCQLAPYAPRRAAWRTSTPASQAETTKTHLERWMAAHRSALSKTQLDALTALIAAVTPISYTDGSEGEAARAKALPIQHTMEELFSSDQKREMSVTDGACIAKAK